MASARKALLLGALLALAVPAPAPAAPPEGTVLAAGGPTAIGGSYIVVLHEKATAAVAAAYGGTVTRTYRHALHGFEAELSESAAKRLAADPAVVSVTQNHTVSTVDVQAPVPSWGLDRVDQRTLPLDGSFTYPSVRTAVRAYVIDTGVRLTHSDFGGRAVSGFDIMDNDPDASDCEGHGTHVAGTLGGNTYGVAKNVQIVAVRVLGCQGQGTIGTVIGGVDWVTADHTPGQPAVANMSLGGGAWDPLVRAVTNSIADGVTYAVAAGNENGADACTRSPANTPNAITVAATRPDDTRAPFSNIGSCVDVFAPGTDIVSAGHTSDTAVRTASGTSMASPHVAGAAALILADHPTYTPAEVTGELLADSTREAVKDPGTGSSNRLLYVDPVTPEDDFTLAAAPAAGSVRAGGSLTVAVGGTVTRGAPQQVRLSAVGLPPGATASFAPATIGSDGGSTLTIATADTTPAGTFTVAVLGTGVGATRQALYRLTVVGAPGCIGGNATDTALPLGNILEVPVTISGCAGTAARNSTIEVHLPHDYLADLNLDLIAPDGTAYALLARTGWEARDLDYTFSYDLSSEQANGTWKLRVSDYGPMGGGYLDSWTLNVAGQNLPVPVCGGLSTTRVKIPDEGTADSPITVRGCDRAASGEVYVEVRVSHTWARDVSVSLVAPDGEEIELQGFNGQGIPNVYLTFIVNFSGKPANGVWKLRVRDYFWGNEGTIDGWKLTL
ncbi:hypothetical protein Val02_52970 [Virgisporangium aliadipatigenens]|uniref:P/Homo B domain-containing protein n=1 Tax=Virgisporangium aliadipatigenens TaxID=741659 RepID=A0A8J3YR96_9ACTN|nr:S8 family serine peptidase [Virgisporangium aliadipatigenens]GIJ48411.1 hypothetical protein Val02_52970 [Virgisporangium aliadipatigenens]